MADAAPISASDREREKQASRERDVHDVVSGQKSLADLRAENRVFDLHGASVDFSKSTSRLW